MAQVVECYKHCGVYCTGIIQESSYNLLYSVFFAVGAWSGCVWIGILYSHTVGGLCPSGWSMLRFVGLGVLVFFTCCVYVLWHVDIDVAFFIVPVKM